MILTYRKWRSFCEKLSRNGITSVPASDVLDGAVNEPFTVLKHDVETNVKKALYMAQLEHRYGHRGSYYVQAYLLNDENNVRMLQQMQQMGHEISYHFDVMDSNHGNLDAAINEFDENLNKFRKAGFPIKTLCQHGNPVVERVGYTSNRDFFRAEAVQSRYPELCDIMVDFPAKANREYLYYSDAGRQFHLIFDPINNDRNDSAKQDIAYKNLNEVFAAFRGQNAIISAHPHRYSKSAVIYSVKAVAFYVVKAAAKLLMKIPFMKKLMGKYYYLAKKI